MYRPAPLAVVESSVVILPGKAVGVVVAGIFRRKLLMAALASTGRGFKILLRRLTVTWPVLIPLARLGIANLFACALLYNMRRQWLLLQRRAILPVRFLFYYA